MSKKGKMRRGREWELMVPFYSPGSFEAGLIGVIPFSI